MLLGLGPVEGFDFPVGVKDDLVIIRILAIVENNHDFDHVEVGPRKDHKGNFLGVLGEAVDIGHRGPSAGEEHLVEQAQLLLDRLVLDGEQALSVDHHKETEPSNR